jgi:hypothetical protein
MIELLLAWLLAAPAEAASCSGPACDEVRVETRGGCVWVQSRSRERVEVDARLGQGAVTLALEPVDPKKADEQEVRGGAGARTSGRSKESALCRRVLASEKSRNEMRRRGRVIPVVPEIEGAAAQCRRSAAATKAEQETGVHTYVFDPLLPNSKGIPVYRARLAQGAGCVARVEDIQSYRARYPGRPAVDVAPAPPRLASACSGDACGSVVFGEDCRARNTGARPIALKVRTPGINLEVKSVAPGGSVKLQTFTSCVKPQDITAYEANHVK